MRRRPGSWRQRPPKNEGTDGAYAACDRCCSDSSSSNDSGGGKKEDEEDDEDKRHLETASFGVVAAMAR